MLLHLFNDRQRTDNSGQRACDATNRPRLVVIFQLIDQTSNEKMGLAGPRSNPVHRRAPSAPKTRAAAEQLKPLHFFKRTHAGTPRII